MSSFLFCLSLCSIADETIPVTRAEINELVARLAQRTDKTDALLAEIAKNVKDGKTTKMDPALSNEVKKLLGYRFFLSLTSDLRLTSPSFYSGVQSGVEAHVSDFRGKLTSEVSPFFVIATRLAHHSRNTQVQRMFKEVRLQSWNAVTVFVKAYEVASFTGWKASR